MQRVLTIVFVLACAAFAAACGGEASFPFGPPAPMEAGAAAYTAVALADVEAFAGRDAAAERALYAEDIVIVDGDDTAEGVDEVVSIAEFIWAQFPEYEEAHRGTYVGATDGIIVMDQWGWQGFTESDPLHEYRIIEVDRGVITAWEATYDIDTRPYFGRGGVDEEALALRERYLAAWNSGDAVVVGGLYAPDAVRFDPLFGEPADGRDEIVERAAEMFERLAGMSFDPVSTIALRSHVRVDVGGVVSITWDIDPCTVEAVFWMESEEGLIVRERAYYDVESLVACGWLGEE